MTRRCLMICLVLVAVWTMPRTASARPRPTEQTPQPVFSYTAEQRRTIREMPIVQRPDRTGHFYGNAVRRRHRRAHGR